MTPAPHSVQDVESAAEHLQEELVRLEIQRQALQRELAAVEAHLGSVQQTLGTLRVLMVGTDRTDAVTADATNAERTDAGRTYGLLTDRTLEYFAAIGDVDVRARDVATALGRDTDSGSVNAVRSTLDRLVGASRLRRTGRGLYRRAPT